MNYELMENNKVFLRGTVASAPVFSHESFGEGFYEVFINIERLSNNFDTIPVIISEKLLDNSFVVGNLVAVQGQFRSYNKFVDGKSKLILNVFVRSVVEIDYSMNPNLVEISGFICKEPVFRTTPFGREICDVLIAVNRSYNKSDYLPAIAWGRNARYLKNFVVGQKVSIIGRIQSREYQKKLDDDCVETRVAYEISINKICMLDDNINSLNVEQDKLA